MSIVGQRERRSQDRIVSLLRDELGYRYLGSWKDHEDNSNVEQPLLTRWLGKRGVSDTGTVRRRQVLAEWYRDQLKGRIRMFIEQWEPIIGEEVADWGVRKMKTKWGICSTRRRWRTGTGSTESKGHFSQRYT